MGAAERLRAALADAPMHRRAIDELLGDQKADETNRLAAFHT